MREERPFPAPIEFFFSGDLQDETRVCMVFN